MNRPGRILVMDDLERWQEALESELTDAGYLVDVAGTIAEAFQYLKEKFYHLLILDIRMDEEDPDNVEGMHLLERLHRAGFGIGETFYVVMLSAYGTKEQMREAFAKYNVTDFAPKDEFAMPVFLEQIQQIFKEGVQININLQVHWQGIDAKEAVQNLWIGDQRIKRNSGSQQQLGEELDDLLCRLFYNAQELVIHPLARGMSGTGVLQAQPFYKEGGGQTMIVKYGDVPKIHEEYVNFKAYVQNFIGGNRRTTVINLRRTSHLGGIVYSLLGTEGDILESFRSFYDRASVSQIIDVLDRLFLDTCKTWYGNPGNLTAYNLTEHYQQVLNFDKDRLQAAFDRLRNVQGKNQIRFNALSEPHAFVNPTSDSILEQSFTCPTYKCITHGDFNEANILIDEGGNAWLIDFLRTGRGHILRDVAELDAVVRFVLLAEEDATLDERLSMEKALVSVKRFSQIDELENAFATENPALAKAYAVSVHLHKIARQLVSHSPTDSTDEYHIAMLYNALNTTRFYSLPTGQREHAILSAALLAERLTL